MLTNISHIFSSLGVIFEENHSYNTISEVKCLGRIKHLPELLKKLGAKKGQLFWSSSNSWIGFNNNDLESWLVDAPLGDHIILIENGSNLDFHFESPDGINVELWGRDELALIIGYGFLEGILVDNSKNIEEPKNNLKNNLDINVIEEADQFSEINGLDVICLNSKVNPNESLESLGISQIPCQPILLELGLWLIKGKLKGPDNSFEYNNWIILEDFFRNKFTVEEDLNLIHKIPNLPILSLGFSNSDVNLRNNLNKLCDVRRHESISTSELNSGKLLRWWKLELNSIEQVHKRILIPSWFFKSHLEGDKIIHGLTGEVLNFEGEMKGID